MISRILFKLFRFAYDWSTNADLRPYTINVACKIPRAIQSPRRLPQSAHPPPSFQCRPDPPAPAVQSQRHFALPPSAASNVPTAHNLSGVCTHANTSLPSRRAPRLIIPQSPMPHHQSAPPLPPPPPSHRPIGNRQRRLCARRRDSAAQSPQW